MGVHVQCDISEYRTFFERMKSAKNDFQKELENWMDAVGVEFLNEVREQIIERSVMVSTELLHSFKRGEDNNFWEADYGAYRLTLEVGTRHEYASWVNNGHNQQPGRFIPGHWKTILVQGVEKDTFVYDADASEGMVLKVDHVEGKHYFDKAIEIIAPQFEKSFERRLQQWLDEYFAM